MPETLFLQFTFHLLIHSNRFTTLRAQMHELNTLEALPRGGGGVRCCFLCLNFETSHVGVYKCFTLLLEIEQILFVFVRILEKGDSNAL